jgi:FKBP-type peptidyl-prolyl cis-trans isomerase
MSDIALAKGEKFLEDNAKKDGVTVTASGLQYKVITPGTGKSPQATDTVEVHYARIVAASPSSSRSIA